MLEAHADEIGFMVRNITEEGFLYVTRIGGSDRAIARGKKVIILGDKGAVRAVIGNTAIHIREKENDKIPEVHELFFDIGASSKEEAEGRGIRVGHPAIFADTAEAADEYLRHLWSRLGYDPDDQATWEKPSVHMPPVRDIDVRTFAPKAWQASCELIGGAERMAPGNAYPWTDAFIVVGTLPFAAIAAMKSLPI